MTVQLNTLSPKKWSGNYAGIAPTIDITDGVRVGDLAIDTSQTPPVEWMNYDNTNGAPIWKVLEQPGVLTRTTTYTIKVSDSTILANTAGGGFTLTLPSAVGISEKKFRIVKTSSDSNTLVVATTGAQTISGNSTLEIEAQWVSLDVMSNGSNYVII